MQAGQLILVRTDPATQFRGALNQHAAATLDIPMTPIGQTSGDGTVDGGLAAGGTVRARLKSMNIISVENLDWEVWLWATGGFQGTNNYTQMITAPFIKPLGRWGFVAANAARIAATGLYYYYIDGLDQVYQDDDSAGEVHLMLVNRSAAAKTAGDGGAIQIQLGFEPSYGW